MTRILTGGGDRETPEGNWFDIGSGALISADSTMGQDCFNPSFL